MSREACRLTFARFFHKLVASLLAVRETARWSQFTIKTMLTVVALLGVTLSLCGAKLQEKRHEREAVMAIEQLGGFVAYDWHLRNLHATSAQYETGPPGAPWLRALFGDDILAHVALVQCGARQPITDSDLRFLDGLPTLVEFRLVNANVTRSGLKRISSIRIERLFLKRVSVRDGGWAELACATALHQVHICKCRFTDADLSHLTRLANLDELWLLDTDVTDAGVRALKSNLPKCRIVYHVKGE